MNTPAKLVTASAAIAVVWTVCLFCSGCGGAPFTSAGEVSLGDDAGSGSETGSDAGSDAPPDMRRHEDGGAVETGTSDGAIEGAAVEDACAPQPFTWSCVGGVTIHAPSEFCVADTHGSSPVVAPPECACDDSCACILAHTSIACPWPSEHETSCDLTQGRLTVYCN